MQNGYDRYLDKQFGMGGGFFNALFEAIARADEGNLTKLAAGFPEEVDAYKTWTRIGRDEFLAKCSPDHVMMSKIKDGSAIL